VQRLKVPPDSLSLSVHDLSLMPIWIFGRHPWPARLTRRVQVHGLRRERQLESRRNRGWLAQQVSQNSLQRQKEYANSNPAPRKASPCTSTPKPSDLEWSSHLHSESLRLSSQQLSFRTAYSFPFFIKMDHQIHLIIVPV